MVQVNIHEAKTHLSKLVARAEAGEEIVIARDGKPVVRMEVVRPAEKAAERRRLSGCMRDEVWTVDDAEMARVDAAIALSMATGRPIEMDEAPAAAE